MSAEKTAIEKFIKKVEEQGWAYLKNDLIGEFDKQEKDKESALKFLFLESFNDYAVSESLNNYAEESDPQKALILMKVTCLNEYYSAGLNSNKPLDPEKLKKKIAPDLLTMAGYIYKQKDELNKLMKKGDLGAVALIWSIAENERPSEEGEYSCPYSFATKYCSWHNTEAYPIVDNYSKGMIYYLCSSAKLPDIQAITKNNLDDPEKYEGFCDRFKEIKTWIKEKTEHDITTKELDKCLWYFAKTKGVKLRK